MVFWRRRLIFKQSIKNKAHKYDVKLHEVCKLNSLILKIAIYAEKLTKPKSILSHAAQVVLRLMDKGYILFTVNYYNLVPAISNLTSNL